MSSIWQTLKSALGTGGAPAHARRRTAGASAPHSPYHACTIEPGEDACAAVTRLREKRFLPMDAPRLPLPECGRLRCDCRYRHHEDRRRWDHDQRFVGSVATGNYTFVAEERRCNNGRRAGDEEF